MSYPEVMAMPLRAFWSMNAQIARLRAEASLQQIDLFIVANSNSDPKMIASLREALSEQMGHPMQEDKSIIPSMDQHKQGIDSLRKARSHMREEGS